MPLSLLCTPSAHPARNDCASAVATPNAPSVGVYWQTPRVELDGLIETHVLKASSPTCLKMLCPVMKWCADAKVGALLKSSLMMTRHVGYSRNRIDSVRLVCPLPSSNAALSAPMWSVMTLVVMMYCSGEMVIGGSGDGIVG